MQQQTPHFIIRHFSTPFHICICCRVCSRASSITEGWCSSRNISPGDCPDSRRSWTALHHHQSFLNGGFNIALVTNILANTLKAKKKPFPMRIEGLNSDSTSQHTEELTLSSVMDRDGEELVTDCHIVNDIIDVPCKLLLRLHSSRERRWQTGAGRVGLTLSSMEDMSYCYHPDLCCSANKKLEARKSIFGWYLQ